MKPAVIITKTILVCGLATGSAYAQHPKVVQNTHTATSSASAKPTAASNTPNAHTAATATHPQVKHAVAMSKPSIRTTPSGAHVANAKAKRHLWRHWVNGRLVEEWVVGPGEGGPAGAAQEEASASGNGNNAPANESIASDQSPTPNPKYTANGKRDPFISPVVSHAGGSGCSTGKKCLEIGAINLRGVVHSDGGFIAVVSNGLNKAYFLRENDPVFNGYVVKITGDSIVFQETVQDRLGKSSTREVVKKITTPAV
jgi:Tfp pilus assembly protein PilP